MESKTLTRTELYELVWSKPLTILSKEFGYSDNGLRKICVKHNIPLPKVGHWAKIKHNKRICNKPLPKDDGLNTPIRLYIDPKGDGPNFHPNQGRTKKKKEIEDTLSMALTVPEKLRNPDPLIKKAKMDMKNKKPSEWGNTKGLVYTSEGILNIAVSKPNISRALLFMDTLIKLLKKRGHTSKVSRDTEVVVNEEPMKIRFREVLKRVMITENNWQHSELVPSGILSFRIDSGYPEKQWRDSTTIPLESRLSDILTYIEIKAKLLKEERTRQEIQMRKWEEESKREEEIKRRKEDELVNVKKLFETASRWQKSQDLRDYIKEVENIAIKKNALTEEKQKWIEWANSKADWLDPIIAKEDAILGYYPN